MVNVWITSDVRAKEHVIACINSGKTLPGVVMATQRRLTPSRLVDFLERLAVEENPFAGVIRFLPPGSE